MNCGNTGRRRGVVSGGRGLQTESLCSELPAWEILEGLRETAGRLRFAFIAGIVIDGRTNSAYWVNAKGSKLMSLKMGDDGRGVYDACRQTPDPRNPIARANACIGSLISMDATDDQVDIHQRRNSLLTRLKEGKGHHIVCVSGPIQVHEA